MDRIPIGEITNCLPFIRNEKEPLENGWYCVANVESVKVVFDDKKDADDFEDEIDEELDYGYGLDEGVDEESEEEYYSDNVDDALGAEDGEEAEDELDNLGFGA